MAEKGRRTNTLKQEVDLLQSLVLDESVSWMRDGVLKMFQEEMEWTAVIESALSECGINVFISEGSK